MGLTLQALNFLVETRKAFTPSKKYVLHLIVINLLFRKRHNEDLFSNHVSLTIIINFRLKKKAFDSVLFFFLKKVDTIQLAWTQSAKNATTCFSFTSQESLNESFHACRNL